MVTKTLTDLANLYGSHKGSISSVAHREALNYTDIYEAYLGRLRRTPLNILQIGLGATARRRSRSQDTNEIYLADGIPLKIWHDYFEAATIYGMDTNPCISMTSERITTFVLDAGNPQDIQSLAAATGEVVFDLIFDDGSHHPEAQQLALGLLFPRLRAGGLYFIEDLMSNGLGDGNHGHNASRRAHNTRTMLRHFQSTGEFLEPHALPNPDYLQAEIASVAFHLPRLIVQGKLRLRFDNPIKTTTRFRPGSEQLCALTKR
ncbi:MAG: hypothetical protein ABTQ73_09140 [Caldilineales bacterium]